MSARARAPRRRKKTAGARLRPFWILFVLVAAGAAVGGYYAATWPGFYPKSVSVSGNRVVPTAEIVSRAAISRRRNLWLQNPHAIARRIEAIPYVKTAAVHRSLPASVHITVTERKPFAVLAFGRERAIVDRDLRVLQTGAAADTLPVIVAAAGTMPSAGAFVRAPQIRQLRDDYIALGEAHVAVRSLQYDKFGDLDAVTRGGIRLLLGDDADVAKKAPLVDPIISQVSATGKRLSAVDLRAPRTPVVVYKP